jgi:hypothetical protein
MWFAQLVGVCAPLSGGGGGDIPEGFEAVTQDGLTVTQDGEPVYVTEE